MTRPVRKQISVIVITRNEERNIEACLQSVAWAEEIIVVDAQSEDRTAEIARKYTDKVYVTEWLGFAEAKTYALEQASHDWIFWLDADERVPQELATEIGNILQQDETPHVGYEVARRAFFLGKWIRHCGWYPGYVVRFFRKSAATFSRTRVHERLEYSGSIGRLNNDLLHYTDENLEHYFNKFNRYTSLAAEDMADAGKDFTLRDLIIRPPFVFFKMYILRRGFLDGLHGFVLCVLSAAYVFTKYAKLWERTREGSA